MHTILVPIDGSKHAQKALHIACDLGEKYEGRIALLHVLSHGRSASDLLELDVAHLFGPKLKATLATAAENSSEPVAENLLKVVGAKILEQADAKVRRCGLEAVTLSMETGDPAECILVARERTGANTIVMGSRGASDSFATPFGSVSNAVFERAPCTCISVK